MPPTSPPLSIHQNALNADIAALTAKNLRLENELKNLRSDHIAAIDDSEAAYLKIKTLELEAQTKMNLFKREPEEDFNKELVNTLNLRISQLMQENKNLKCEIEQQNVDIQDLQISNKIQKQISQKLSKNINDKKGFFDVKLQPLL